MDMKKSNVILRMTIIAAALLSAASCMTPRKLVYLQDMDQYTQITLENQIEAKISPYDELDIIISCSEPEIARPFNLRTAFSSGGSGNVSASGGSSLIYLVDPNGNIQIPILGEMHVAGMTRLQLQEHIKNLLLVGNYISDPYVSVRFYNFKIFFLGADGGKAITMSNERCTFLEALALSGDISSYTRRDKIGVVREVDGKMTVRYLDPRSSDVFNDPYFVLQQNDMIITRSYGSKYWRDEMNFWSSWVSVATSVASLTTTALVLSNTFAPKSE